ncbi:MAG: succinylglutamate desuccinylase/aspartoacylase family protein [Pirellulales bacterium]|nr:succinylglutamate desuccinylase/aspartoacylase family protein [Pirellulales bacterium]
MHAARFLYRLVVIASAVLLSLAWSLPAAEPAKVNVHPDLAFINTSFENASPLWWEVDDSGAVRIHLIYDHERSSPNRAAGHWHFQLQGKPGADLTLVLCPFDNVWNGKPGSPISDRTIGFTSPDGKSWTPVRGKLLEGNLLQLQVHLDADQLYVARLEPYRLSDLEALKTELAGHERVEITEIGRTVEGRPLEIIRVGSPAAPHHVLLRARSHAWEPGGNWVLEGLIRRLLQPDAKRLLERYCVWVMPMANKDGVARGWTRFNLLGKDLNREWDRPADPVLAPERHALESWLEKSVAAGRRPELAIDLHNDESGKLHVSRPEADPDAYLARMKRLEELLRRHTWFTEGSTGSSFHNPGTFGEGLLQRFGVTACVLELNANWAAGLNDYPSSAHWKQFGAGLADVFFEYFAE